MFKWDTNKSSIDLFRKKISFKEKTYLSFLHFSFFYKARSNDQFIKLFISINVWMICVFNDALIRTLIYLSSFQPDLFPLIMYLIIFVDLGWWQKVESWYSLAAIICLEISHGEPAPTKSDFLARNKNFIGNRRQIVLNPV